MQLWPFSLSFMSIYFFMNMHIETNTAHNSRQTAHLHVLHNDAGKTVKICACLLYKQLLSSIKEAGLEIPYYSIDTALFALRYYNASYSGDEHKGTFDSNFWEGCAQNRRELYL